MTNESAERLRSYLAADFFDKKVPKGYLERIDAALAAERKATVERIRAVEARFAELKETSLMPNSPLWTAGSRASFALAEGLLHAAILDAEAAPTTQPLTVEAIQQLSRDLDLSDGEWEAFDTALHEVRGLPAEPILQRHIFEADRNGRCIICNWDGDYNHLPATEAAR